MSILAMIKHYILQPIWNFTLLILVYLALGLSMPYVLIRKYMLRSLFSLTILLIFVLHSLNILEWEFIQALEHKLYDVRLELTMPHTQDNRIVIVDMDEQSLSEIGRWPWNRAVIAQIITKLFETYQIDILGMDVVFPEPDESSGLKQLQILATGPLKKAPKFLDILANLQTQLDYDGRLAQSLKQHRVVLGYAFTMQKEEEINESGQLPPPLFTKQDIQDNDLKYRSANGYAANLPLFQTNTLSAGHFNVLPDKDGIVRRMPMLIGYQGQLYESLALAVARHALGNSPVQIKYYHHQKQPKFEYLKINHREIPVNEQFESLITYRGYQGSFPYVSATDILHERIIEPELLRNKIVLWGTTAQGLLDLRAVPMQSVYPGVEIHATMISNILNGHLLSILPNEPLLESALLLFIGLIMIVLLPSASPMIATLSTGALVAAIIWLNIFVWQTQLIALPLATTLLLILTLFVFNMSYGYFVESSHKRHLNQLFGQYVPPELVDEMNKNLSNHKFSMEGQSREMTVLFSDVRGFTTISEGLVPQELSQLMNEYLTPMTRIIHEHRGTIDKYMGDAIMAFWGAPLQDSQHARHAVDAALEMISHLNELQLQFLAKGWPQIQIGIGLNTGIMSVGNMGSEFRMAYTVLGDAVNLGSRLEGLTKSYGIPIIISESTRRAAPEYLYRELDRVRVKGKDLPVAIFEPLGLPEQISPDIKEELKLYEQALNHYRQQNWESALSEFNQLQTQFNNRLLYQIYVKRIHYFIANPPYPDWDGVYTFTSK
jgi:adenylate cyclase